MTGQIRVNIYGDDIKVSAKIHNFTGLSAHADKEGLMKWLNCFNEKPDKVFVIHVEESVSKIFLETLSGSGYNAVAPQYKESYDLKDGSLSLVMIKA